MEIEKTPVSGSSSVINQSLFVESKVFLYSLLFTADFFYNFQR